MPHPELLIALLTWSASTSLTLAVAVGCGRLSRSVPLVRTQSTPMQVLATVSRALALCSAVCIARCAWLHRRACKLCCYLARSLLRLDRCQACSG